MPSTVPGENLPPVRERLQMGTRTCGTVGAVDKEKTSLHVLNVPLTVFPICMTWTKFPGMDHFYRKKGPGDHFSTENFSPGDQNFQDQNSGDSPCSWFAESELL